MTDEWLMVEVGRGSSTAFEALFERYRQPVWEFFRRRTPSAEVAEELSQDTFVAVLEGAGRFERSSTGRAYLFGIAYHVLFAARRKAAYRLTTAIEIEPAARESCDPDPGIWVRSALATLDEEEREILMLREYEQLTYQEIADARGTPLNTVRSQLFRARLALKSALETRAPHAVRTTHGRH
jgi:RNA polymerase sigma-70 factor, ECF subfamily